MKPILTLLRVNWLQCQIGEMRSIDFSRVRFDRNQERLLVCSASTKFLHSDQEINEQQLEKTQLFIPNFQLEQQLKHYEWRAKTEFPIVKVADFRLGVSAEGKTAVEVSCQSYPVRLMELKEIPLFKILYLLKEAVIGCERLFDRFGSFMITARMVALSQQSKCKVWLNENFASNQFRSYQIDEKYFLLSLYRLFEARSNKLKNTILFFQELSQSRTFCQALTFIEAYARENKISIPTSCKLTQKEMSVLNNQSGSAFDPSLTMSRAPKFLGAGLRASLKPDSKQMMYDLVQSISIKEEDEHQNNNMKTSGDTAADIYGSKTLSYNEKEKIDESLIFGAKEGSREGSKSGMPTKFNTENQLGFHRKFSSHNEDVHCLTPTYSNKKEWNEQPHFLSNSRWDDKGFYGQQSDEEEVPKVNVANVFTKNNWEKTLNGLFANEQEQMKKSFHHGKQKRSLQQSTNKLQLLGKLGKNIHESFINDYHQYDEDGRPYTSQY